MARYWRMTAIMTWSGTLELSEAQLYEAGSPVAVTPTASVAPTSGNLADLADGLATANVVWSGAMPTLMWDTAGLTAPFPCLGSGTSDETFPVDFILQSSDDGATWATWGISTSLAYPGAQSLLSFADPYFSNVSLLLNGEGSDGSASVVDTSGYSRAITVNGDVHISAGAGRVSGSTIAFDGAGDFLSFPGDAEFTFGASDFTWETWVYRISANNGDFDAVWGASNAPRGLGVTLRNAGQVGIWISTGTTWDVRRGDTNWGAEVVPLNTWTHLAVCRKGNVIRGFVNGMVDQVFPCSGSLSGYDANVHIGRWDGPYTQFLHARLDDFRVTKGVARYEGNFIASGVSFNITYGPRKYKASALARAVYTNPDVGIPTTISVTQHRREFNFLDAHYGGQYQITGTVKEKSTPTNKPLKRRVVLIDERSRLTVAEAWSDATGNYRFYGIRGDLAYTVISYDYSGTYRAVIADNVTPERIV